MLKTQPMKLFKRRLKLIHGTTMGLHEALGWTLVCSRMLGLFPVTGLLKTSSELRFTLKSPFIVVFMITLIGQVILSVMSVSWLFNNGFSLPNVSNGLFYGSSLMNLLILVHVGVFWPRFVKKIEDIENKLPPFTRNINKYCHIITVIIIILAIVEHLLSVMYGVAISTACNPFANGEMFFVYNMPWIFQYVPYHLSLGILFEIFIIQSTFLLSYNDLLIIVLSIYLSEHFCLHYKLLKKAVKQDCFSAETFRIQYLQLTKLVNICNARFGIYVLVSFGFNLYWICMQLFNSLNKKNTGHIIAFDCDDQVLDNTQHGIEHGIYFSFSFSFLVARTLLVILFAAKVNHNSLSPLIVLYEVPPSKYNAEVERFVDQINNMEVAMSGLGFFYVIRTMILTLVGSIITYELVLLQFNR